MGTPVPSAKDAATNDFVGLAIRDYIRENYPRDAYLVDIGAGWGKYKILLPEYDMDAVEIWPGAMDFSQEYSQVFIVDVRHWTPRKRYAGAIFGDSFEHLSESDAKETLSRLKHFVGEFIIAVPYLMKQGEVDNNPHEEHKQADLTRSVMAERYPQLTCIADDGAKGVFVG